MISNTHYSTQQATDYQVAIIGAGFGGMIAALRLLRSGRSSFVIFERASEVGGVWRDNVYPGCACDIPSKLYSIESEPNPDWSMTYSSQAEIWDYMKNIARKHNLAQYIRFDTEIVRSEFIEEDGYWSLTDQMGRQTSARTVILATGPFKQPKMPDIEGLGSFLGSTLHSARWDRHCDLRGKKVAIVGTGASAAQIAPTIAPDVAHLTVFQRSATWIVDRFDGPVSPFARRLFRRFPYLHTWARSAWYHLLEWKGRGFMGDKTGLWIGQQLSLMKLKREVRDPELRRQLTPTHPMGCKRVIVSDAYLPMFNRSNVRLETKAIEQVTPGGVRVAGGEEMAFDAIVFATGFEITEPLADICVYGRKGRELYAEWRKNGMEAYKGTLASGFPNWHTLLGPNSGLGHNSVLLIMEAQMEYILQYLDFLEKQAACAALDVKPSIQVSYNKDIQNRLKKMVWAAGCRSWYLDARGKNTTVYPGGVGRFRKDLKRFNPDDYVVLNPSEAPVHAVGQPYRIL